VERTVGLVAGFPGRPAPVGARVVPVAASHANDRMIPMGDKSPKSRDKDKKQSAKKKAKDKVKHDKKQDQGVLIKKT
jgi:hypothetical protein